MKTFGPPCLLSLPRFVLALLFLGWSAAGAPGSAQTANQTVNSPVANLPAGLPVPAQADRVDAGADLQARSALPGQLPSWVDARNLTTQAVSPSTPLHLTLVLERAPQVQAAFEKLLADQQEPGSPLYHHWLTPAQVGALYGPTQHDVDAVTGWAAKEGLTVESTAASRVLVELTGTVAAVSQAFRTSFSYYRQGETPRMAADSAPMVPTALLPVVRAIDGLADVPPVPLSQHASALAQPEFTNGSSHYMTPGDFAVIYDVTPLTTAGNNGATVGTKPQHIAIMDESDLVPQDIADYAAKVGIGSYTLNTIQATTTDPGIGSSQGESTLDVMRTVGTAPGAVTDLVIASSVYTSAVYAVNTLLDPVLTISWGSCDYGNQSTVTKWDTLWSQAAAEGISVFVSSGDSGAAGCDTHSVAAPATQYTSTNAICASTYATCVGGTEFNDTANPALYWGSTNSSSRVSALSYIPEGAWNDPGTAGAYVVKASGGGASAYILKPSWQTGTGVPADGYRDEPDVALSASGHDGYYGCLNLNCESGSFEYFSGTSAAAPGMAAITALLNTHAGGAQGNLNPLIYRLANSPAASSIFHDTTVASSGVTGCTTATPSMCNNSTPSTNALTGGLAGYVLTTGFDQVTGWGSVDVANFVTAAVPVTTTLGVTGSATQIALTQTATFTATLTPASTSVASPTGTVQFSVNGVATGSRVNVSNNTAVSATQSFPSVGKYTVTATYSGDSYYSASTAPGTTLTVAAASFTMSPANAALSFTSGASAGNTDGITVSSAYGFAGTVALTCSLTTSSAAFQPTCAVSPASVTLASGGTSTATVTIGSTTAQALVEAPRMPGTRPGGTLFAATGCVGAVLGVFLWLVGGRRRLGLRRLALVLVAASFVGISGCGGKETAASTTSSTPLRSSAGTYTVTVSGVGTTATSTGITAVTTFSVTIN